MELGFAKILKLFLPELADKECENNNLFAINNKRGRVCRLFFYSEKGNKRTYFQPICKQKKHN